MPLQTLRLWLKLPAQKEVLQASTFQTAILFPPIFHSSKTLQTLLRHLQSYPLLPLELPTNLPTPVLSATMNHSTLPLKAEPFLSLFSNVLTLNVPPVLLTMQLHSEESALPVFLTMKSLMKAVRSSQLSAEMERRMVLRLVTMAILLAETAVQHFAFRRLITCALDSQAPALFRVSVGIQSFKLLMKPVTIQILFLTMDVQTRVKLRMGMIAH